MALENYILNGPSVVIEIDKRDPWTSWQNHLDRTGGLRGGVDLVALTPAPVLAPTDGIMYWLPANGTAGNSCRFKHTDNPGWADVFSHLSSYVGSDGQFFRQGEIIGYTGATGGVAPHLHRHLLDPQGVRRNPWNYFSKPTVAEPAAIKTSPVLVLPTLPLKRKKKRMPLGYSTVNHGKQQWGYGDGAGLWVSIETQANANAVSKLIGRFTVVSVASFNDIRAAYLAG